ncbi:MAG: energy-converting hydrogenase A subunit A EhaA [Methanobacterium sp.]
MFINVDTGTLINYILVLISAFVVGLFLRMPILPEKPMRNSWTISIIFPTLIIAVGFYAVISNYGLGNYYSGVVIGIFTALFSKYLLEKVFPRPDLEDEKMTNQGE